MSEIPSSVTPAELEALSDVARTKYIEKVVNDLIASFKFHLEKAISNGEMSCKAYYLINDGEIREGDYITIDAGLQAAYPNLIFVRSEYVNPEGTPASLCRAGIVYETSWA
jgi:hypothetical protein